MTDCGLSKFLSVFFSLAQVMVSHSALPSGYLGSKDHHHYQNLRSSRNLPPWALVLKVSSKSVKSSCLSTVSSFNWWNTVPAIWVAGMVAQLRRGSLYLVSILRLFGWSPSAVTEKQNMLIDLLWNNLCLLEQGLPKGTKFQHMVEVTHVQGWLH